MPTWQKRIYEIIPGALVWGILLASILVSFWQPLYVIYFIIAFDLFWLYRVVYWIFYLTLSWRGYVHAQRTDWAEKVKELPEWNSIYHYVLLPTAGETFELLDATLQGLVANKLPLDKFIVHVAGEERKLDTFSDISKRLLEKYGSTFFKFITSVHPDGVVGEMKGKGANTHYAGHEAKKLFDEWKIPYEQIMCSYFDSDTIVHPQYFAYLTYTFLTTPDRQRKAYQPAVNYNNNIWEAPAITRITAFGTVFWLLAELARPERMYTFSSHSMPFKALVDVDFWQKDIVTDDSRIFLQGFFRYKGDFEVIPLYIPVSMEAVQAPTIMQSANNLYKQQRRWAWGVEHFPYVMEKFREIKGIPFWKRAKYVFNMMEGNFSWATAPILIFILGRLPLWVASTRWPLSDSVMVQNTPYVLEWLMTASMIGILVSALFSLLILPQRPKHHARYKWLIMLAQWVMLPVTLILFGAFPAIDAQTRLMLGGKYRLGFWVTPKGK